MQASVSLGSPRSTQDSSGGSKEISPRTSRRFITPNGYVCGGDVAKTRGFSISSGNSGAQVSWKSEHSGIPDSVHHRAGFVAPSWPTDIFMNWIDRCNAPRLSAQRRNRSVASRDVRTRSTSGMPMISWFAVMGPRPKPRHGARNYPCFASQPSIWRDRRTRRKSRISMMDSSAWAFGVTEPRGPTG